MTRVLPKMLEEQARRGASVIALLEVDPSVAHMYGIATVEPTDDPDVVRITGLVEKPAKGTGTVQLGDHRSVRVAAGSV